jgi:hypothetical protein
MINIDVTLGSTGTSSGAAASSTQTAQLSSLSAQSFTTLLSEALSETLSKFGIDPNSIKLTVQDTPSQTLAASQSPATSQTPAGGQTASVSQTPAATVNLAAIAPAVVAPAIVTPASSTAATHSNTWYASTPADDAYWSKQPAAVQQLRGIEDLDERKQLGEQLASEGYSIDVPIMVWGWDAGKVTAARESYGYTWVPSAMQQPVSAAPGITGAGIVQYDPSHPPSGSIQV